MILTERPYLTVLLECFIEFKERTQALTWLVMTQINILRNTKTHVIGDERQTDQYGGSVVWSLSCMYENYTFVINDALYLAMTGCGFVQV